MRPLRLALVALCCLAGLAGIAAVASAPPPTQLCGSCGSAVPGATGAGTLDIAIDADGDSEWVERVPVNESAADRYREDSDALERAVDDAWNASYLHLPGRTEGAIDRTATLENGTVTVTYAVDDVARPGVRDAWLVDYFALGQSTHRYGLAAERVTIHTPEDTVVTNTPRHASVDENRVTWTGGTDDSGWPTGDFDSQTRIVYGSSGLVGTAAAYAMFGLNIGFAALAHGITDGLVPGALLAGAGLAVGRVDRGRDAFDTATLERLIAVVGLVGAVGLLVVSAAATGRPFTPGLGALSALGVGYAALGVAARRNDQRHTTRGLVELAVFAAVATGTALWVLGGSLALLALPFGLATALFLPIGFAFERRSSQLEAVPLLLVGLTALAPIAAATGLSSFVTPAGLGVVLYWLALVYWVGVAVVFGYPLALLGRRLAADRGTD